AEARDALERSCARLAAARRAPEHLGRMAAEIKIQRNPALSGEEFCASDVRFHRALVDAAGNPVLGFVMGAVIEALQPASNMVIDRFRDRTQAADQHQRLLDAIAAGNADAAEAAVGSLIATLKAQYGKAQDTWQTRHG
ncbi:MAG: FCD domain-containing protein, partial [Rhodospirillaceae bacterium]